MRKQIVSSGKFSIVVELLTLYTNNEEFVFYKAKAKNK